MKKSRLIFTLAAVLFCIGSLSADEALIETIKKEAPAAWEKYLESLKVLDVSTDSVEQEGDAEPVQSKSQRYSRYPCYLQKTEEAGNSYVSGGNSQYSFLLYVRDGKNDLVKVRDCRNSQAPLSFPSVRVHRSEQNHSNWFVRQSAAALKLNHQMWLPSYFNEPEFRITEAEEVREGDLRLVRMKFQYEPADYDPGIPLRGGEVYLMPDHSWVIKRGNYVWLEIDEDALFDYRIAVKNGNSDLPYTDGKRYRQVRVEHDYGKTPDRLPRPVSQTLEIEEFNWKYTSFYTWEKPGRISPKEFRLPHYGFPEPDFVCGFRARLPLIAAGAALILLAACRSFRKRKSLPKEESAAGRGGSDAG
ncbi:MAG: hypothetical protein IKE69_09330 [Thermoguttaceae bacterium]|nr:hypothetical protein [Thermoguttaceae bacterium]